MLHDWIVSSDAFERLYAACNDGDLEAVKAVLGKASKDQRTALFNQQESDVDVSPHVSSTAILASTARVTGLSCVE